MIQKNPIKLIDSICDNFMNGFPGRNWAPKMDGQVRVTYCNYFVAGVSKSMGYGAFTHDGTTLPMTANEMFDFLNDPSNGWLDVEGMVAQSHANAGALVIAAEKNVSGHGHVCMVRPGEFQFSAHWGKKSPRVANIGKDVFIDRGASFAFVNEPRYFVLAQML